MSNGVLFKGNIEEGSYKLIKTTDGWVLVGKDIAFAGSDITDRTQGEWKKNKTYNRIIFCSECGEPFEQSNSAECWNFCPNCGADMRGE